MQQYGIGQPVPIKSFSSQFDGKTALIWADGTNGSAGASSPTAAQIIEHITASFTPSQRAAVRQLSDPAEIPAQCPQNFNLFSSCFAAVAFYDIPGPSAANVTSGGITTRRSVNYTISADSGLQFIDVVNHKSDFEKRVLPLQWAIDQVCLVRPSRSIYVANRKCQGYYRIANWHSAADTPRMALQSGDERGAEEENSTQYVNFDA